MDNRIYLAAFFVAFVALLIGACSSLMMDSDLEAEVKRLKEDRQRRDLGAIYPTKEEIKMVEAKSIFESKTVWFNVITGIVSIAAAIPPPFGAIVLTVGNLVLRIWFTEKPVVLIKG